VDSQTTRNETDNNILLLTNMGAGHGGASGRYESLRDSLRVCLCYRPIRFDFDMSPKLSDRRECCTANTDWVQCYW